MSTQITNAQGVNKLNPPNPSPTAAEILAERQLKLESNLPLDQLDEAAKRRRYELLRSKLGSSRLEVKGRADRHYFWAPHSDNNEMSRLDGLGYNIVREDNPKEVLAGKAKGKISANGLREDGTYVIGDVILTECSLETYEFIMLHNSERHEEMVSGAQRDFRSEAERLAVPTFEHVK